MKDTFFRKKKVPLAERFTSLWLLVGGIIILGVAITFMTIRGIRQENRQLERFYEERGASLITALEAGTRTDFRHNSGNIRLQTLFEEMANQPGILFMMATDSNGVVIAHSNSSALGAQAFLPEQLEQLKAGKDVSWRVMAQNGEEAFVVYREFRPFAFAKERRREMMPPMRKMRERMWRERLDNCPPKERIFRRQFFPDTGPPPVIYIGLDGKTFATTLRANKEHALVNAVFILLIGFIGFVALTWAQRARLSRERMKSTEALAHEVMYNLPDGLVVTDAEGRIAMLNDMAVEQLNIGDADVAGKMPSEALPDCVARLIELSSEELVSEVEVECTGAMGQRIPIGVSGSEVLLEDGDSVGFVFLLRDLREVRRLEAEVRRKEKLAAVGSLAAGVAHEIRNPLSSIKGYATYFGSRFAEGSEDRNAANIMVHEVERLNRVISDLINLSRPSDLHRMKTDVNQLAEHCFGLIKQDAVSKQIELELHTDPTIPELQIDPDRMSQAILNICLNSFEAMDEGGKLSLVMSHDREFVSFALTDTGKGMRKEDIARIFEPYFTTKSQGTGLGLSIVLKIVEAHGGTIRVDSEEGAGTMFEIKIPVSPVGENA